eukprot:15472575-Alexandrium_andersonii.AAC.1
MRPRVACLQGRRCVVRLSQAPQVAQLGDGARRFLACAPFRPRLGGEAGFAFQAAAVPPRSA